MIESDAHLAAQSDGEEAVRIHIRPNRSLPPQEFLPLFIAVSAVLVTIGVGFALLGAWPVLPFAGIEIVVVGLVFRWLYRHHDDEEQVVVSADRVRVVRRCGGHEQVTEYNRYWARVSVAPAASIGQPMQLRIGSHGRFVEIGAEVREEDRRRLADELKAVLARGQ